MQAHLSVNPQGELVLDPTLPNFTEEELNWRIAHIGELQQLSREEARRIWALTATQYPIHGFDISSYQPSAPNFRAGNRQFAIFKATEGITYRDAHFAANRAAAHAEGCVAVGIYHFARPGQHSAAAEANWFLQNVGARQPGEFAVLDYEVPPWDQAWAVQYITILQSHGWNVAFYTYAGMLSNPTDQIAQATEYLWEAGYSSNEPGSDRWIVYGGWALWQHTDGQYGIVDGPWDCSAARSLQVLQKLAQSAGPVPTPTPTPTRHDDFDLFEEDKNVIIEPAAWRKAQGLSEEVPIGVPPANETGGGEWKDVYGSLMVDNKGEAPDYTNDVRLVVHEAGHGPGDGWYTPAGSGNSAPAVGDTVHLKSGRSFWWKYQPGDEGASITNHGNHAVFYLTETAPRS